METQQLIKARIEMMRECSECVFTRSRFNRQMVWVKQLVEKYHSEHHDVPVMLPDGNVQFPQLVSIKARGWLNGRPSNFETRYFWQRLYPTAQF